MSFTVAIVGRPNVGKSTLFNRLLGERDAIVDDESGVTRDRIYGVSDWNGKTFNVIDTGGFVPNSNDVFEKAIRQQVKIAIEEASLILFVTDAVTGITDLDDEVSSLLRRTDKPVLLTVNKADNHQRTLLATEFYSLGFKNTFFISAMSGSGTGELLDALAEYVEEEYEDNEAGLPKIAIIGQPNVGKSSLLNALTGQERNIVTDIAGTTRDSIHTRYQLFQKDFLLIDTAGVRKKSSYMDNLEFYSVIRAFKAIDEADVCLLMVDAKAGIEAQDLALFRLIQKKNKGVVVIANKWDTVKDKETNTARDMEKEMKNRLAPFNDVPILFTSVLEKQRIFKGLELALEVHERRTKRITTSVLNQFLQDTLEYQTPPNHRGSFIRINYCTQLPLAYPAFVFFSNYPKHIKQPYRNYIENRLRQTFNFEGVPVTLFFRDK